MRWIVALCIAVMCFTASSAWAASAYDDVPTDHWAYNALDYLTERGVIEGYPDGFFKGDRTLTRYEFAQAIARLLDTIGGVGNVEEQIAIMAETLRAEFSDQLAEIARLTQENGAMIADVEARVGDLEGGVADNASKISALEEKIAGIKPGPKWQGSFLYRWQFDEQGDYNRFRQRIKFKLGYNKQINDCVLVGFRLATNTGYNPTSDSHTLSSEFKSPYIYLDRAFVKYTPGWFGFYTDENCNACTPKLEIYAGIFDKAPAIYDPNEMILSSYVNVHGAAVVYHFNKDFQISTAIACAVEVNGEDYFDDDTYFYATEIRHDNLLIPCLDAWAGCYGWKYENQLYDGDFVNGNVLPGFDFNNDSLVNGDDRFTPNFNTIKAGLKYTFHCMFPKPLAVYGEYMVNVDSDAEDRIDLVNPYVDPDIIFETTDDTGMLIGAQYGAKPKYCGDWYMFARYKEIGANAVIHAFADPATGGANRNSIEVYWGWMWADNCMLGVTYIMHKMHNAFGFEIPASLDDMSTLYIDWNFKF